MNSDKYFKIVSEFGNVIHIKPQDLWTDEIALQYGDKLKDKFRKAVLEMESKNHKFIVLANMSDFHIEGTKTKELLTELMKISGSNKLFYKTIQIIPSLKTRMEIKASSSAAGQNTKKIVVADAKEAKEKILDLKKELLRIL